MAGLMVKSVMLELVCRQCYLKQQDCGLVKYITIQSRYENKKSPMASTLPEVSSRQRLIWGVSHVPKHRSAVTKKRANILKRKLWTVWLSMAKSAFACKLEKPCGNILIYDLTLNSSYEAVQV